MFFQSIFNFIRKNYRALLRMTVLLCIYWLSVGRLLPGNFPIQQEGLGGGILLNEVVSENTEIPAYGLLSQEPQNHETGISEPENFTRPRPLIYNAYTVKQGENISTLALIFGLNESTLFSVNNIKDARILQIGQVLKIPNQDGILHQVSSGDTLEKIAAKYKAEISEIKAVNELFSNSIRTGSAIFIPGAQLDWVTQQEIKGDLFIWPVRGRISSPYGYRSSPFTGERQFHSGLDISSSYGTPVRAAMSGRVNSAGWDNTFGNYVVINHHSGYRTLYAHLSEIRVKSGTYVSQGERIGDVGSTGLSTAPHLHFTVYKNSRTVNPRSLMR